MIRVYHKCIYTLPGDEWSLLTWTVLIFRSKFNQVVCKWIFSNEFAFYYCFSYFITIIRKYLVSNFWNFHTVLQFWALATISLDGVKYKFLNVVQVKRQVKLDWHNFCCINVAVLNLIMQLMFKRLCRANMCELACDSNFPSISWLAAVQCAADCARDVAASPTRSRRSHSVRSFPRHNSLLCN